MAGTTTTTIGPRSTQREKEAALAQWQRAYSAWATAGQAFAERTRELGRVLADIDRDTQVALGLDFAFPSRFFTLFCGSDQHWMGGEPGVVSHSDGAFEIALKHGRGQGWIDGAELAGENAT